jgi:hypothetical protein
VMKQSMQKLVMVLLNHLSILYRMTCEQLLVQAVV